MTIELPSGFRIVVDPVFSWVSDRADLRIRCGGAFGPSHVTTRLCLRLMDRHRHRIGDATVLDVGCGTGILALAAARMGAASCIGLDICGRSMMSARHNAEINNLQSKVRWIQGSTASVRGTFGCVVANLPFPTLWDLLEEILGAVADEGMLLLSGFHDIQWHTIEERLRKRAFAFLEVLSGDLSFGAEPPSGSYTWMALLATRPSVFPAASQAPSSMDNPR